MTAFVGAPAGPHIGQCQNLLRGERADWRDARYCLEPVLALGAAMPADLDICQTCRERSRAYVAEAIASAAAGIAAAGPEQADMWIVRAEANLVDLDRWLCRRAGEHAPMAELFKIRRDIELRERLLAAVVGACG